MRLLALADTQIGVATVDLQDQADVLERIVNVALEHEVDAVLHGGDVFEGPHVTPEQMRVFLDAVKPLRLRAIPILVIRGNGRHDSAVRRVHALDVLNEIPGILVHDRPDIEYFAGVAVCTLPWVHPGRMIASLEEAWGERHEQAVSAIGDGLVAVAHQLAEQAGPQHRKILLAHWAISGALVPSGLKVEELGEPVVPWAELDALGYSLILGAHIHQPQPLSQGFDHAVGFVIGSPQQLNHGEHGEHGCWLIDLPGPAGEDVRSEFVPIESRQFITINAEDEETTEIPDGAIIRYRYTLPEEEARYVDHDIVRQELLRMGASRVTIEPTIIRAARARAETVTEQLSPGEALAAYCVAQEISDPLRGRMLAQLDDWVSA